MRFHCVLAAIAVLLLPACASVAPPAPPAEAAAPVAAPAQPSETPVFVEEVDTPAHNDFVTCKEESPTGTRLPAIICTLAQSERDRSPGAVHQVYIEPR
jgi:hypothetical protein